MTPTTAAVQDWQLGPPLGTWVKDRHGGVAMRRIDSDSRDGWGQPGYYSFAKWVPMWEARGPLVICGPWGADDIADDPRGGV